MNRFVKPRAAVLGVVGLFSALAPRAVEPLPAELSDEQFRRIITSNVERYLFGTPRASSDAWKCFYANVAMLPVDESSTFIRTGANVEQSVLGSIPKLLAAYGDGTIQKCADIPGR